MVVQLNTDDNGEMKKITLMMMSIMTMTMSMMIMRNVVKLGHKWL